MKKYLIILTTIISILYMATSLIIYDILWIFNISEWTQSERIAIVFAMFGSAIISSFIKDTYYHD